MPDRDEVRSTHAGGRSDASRHRQTTGDAQRLAGDVAGVVGGEKDDGGRDVLRRAETARHRINVNCVCPGPSDTPLFQKEFAGPSPKLADSLKRVIPWGRLGTPEDIAPAVVFLASDEAGYITGQTLSVSGGLTMA